MEEYCDGSIARVYNTLSFFLLNYLLSFLYLRYIRPICPRPETKGQKKLKLLLLLLLCFHSFKTNITKYWFLQIVINDWK